MVKNQKKNKKILSLKEKHNIICELDKGIKQSEIARMKKISPSVVSAIKKDREKILTALKTRSLKTKKVKSSNCKNIDIKLLDWFTVLRRNNVQINSNILIEKAEQIALEDGITGFTCNTSWLHRFKKRHAICFRKICGESNAVNMVTVDEWRLNEWPLLKQEYDIKDIFNADETGLFYRMMPGKTLAFEGDACHGLKTSKERLTVLLCASMLGEKRPAIIIGKYKKPRCFKNKNLERIKYYANKSAWMKSDIFKEELLKWDSELRSKNRKILLLIDNCPSHPDITEILTNIKIVFLPPNTTSILQPMDAGIIANFKLHYRRSLIMELIRCIDLKQALYVTVFDAIHMIEDAWAKVATQTIINCFSHSLDIKTDNAIPEINDAAFDENILEEFSNLFSSQTDFDHYMQIDNNLETTEPEELNAANDTNAEDDANCFIIEKTVSIEVALAALKELKGFYYGENINSIEYGMLLNVEKDLYARYSKKRSKQMTLSDYFTKK